MKEVMIDLLLVRHERDHDRYIVSTS
jgi:hypothetical protein